MPNPLYSLLNLIAATILADKRVYASEVETFIKEASSLELIKTLEPSISEAKLLAWYEINKDAISENLKSHNLHKWLYSILDQLSELTDKASILKVMQNISTADDDFHVSEKALIVLAQRYWDERPAHSAAAE